MGTAILRWQDRSIEETEQRIYRSTEPFDETNLPPILATLPPDVQEYRDSTVLANLDYYYRVSSYRAEPELEVFSDIIEINTSFSLGPGPSELIGGTAEMGFFGEVPVEELINGPELAAKVGLTAGTEQNNNEPWLKFVLDGKIMYVAKKAYRSTISWEQIYQAGLVYGVDGPGQYPSPADSPVNQNKVIEIDGYQFTVRLLKGADEDPSNASNGTDVEGTWSSEWARLMYPICTASVPSYTGPKIANYTEAELDVGSSGTNSASWVQETRSNNTSARLLRGFNSVANLYGYTATFRSNDFGWRPCLVLNV